MLDLLHWNTTLRMDVNTAAKRTEETDRVHSQGLVALSVNGNSITEEGIGMFNDYIIYIYIYIYIYLTNLSSRSLF
jgi:hypothetical protein